MKKHPNIKYIPSTFELERLTTLYFENTCLAFPYDSTEKNLFQPDLFQKLNTELKETFISELKRFMYTQRHNLSTFFILQELTDALDPEGFDWRKIRDALETTKKAYMGLINPPVPELTIYVEDLNKCCDRDLYSETTYLMCYGLLKNFISDDFEDPCPVKLDKFYETIEDIKKCGDNHSKYAHYTNLDEQVNIIGEYYYYRPLNSYD